MEWLSKRPSLWVDIPEDPTEHFVVWGDKWFEIVKLLKREELVAKRAHWGKVHVPCFVIEARELIAERKRIKEQILEAGYMP